MATAPPPPGGPYSAQDLTVVTYRQRRLVMFPVLENELQTMLSCFSSAYLALFGVSCGVFVSALFTLLTVSLTEEMGRRFFDATVIFGALLLILGVLAVRDMWRSRQMLGRIRRETIEVGIVEGRPGPR
jgi:hypothetical protein